MNKETAATFQSRTTKIIPPHKKFMIITSRSCGFFSSFFQVAGQLYLCEKENIIPVVYFKNNSLFWSDKGYNQARNVWEYYFYPVSNYSITDLIDKEISYLETCSIQEFSNIKVHPRYKEEYEGIQYGHIKIPSNILISNEWPSFVPGDDEIFENKRKVFHDLIEKYIKVKSNILSKADRFYGRYFKDQNVVGVHIRGVEHNDEIEGWWNKGFLSSWFYMKEVNAYLKKYPDAKVFIAADNTKDFNEFRNTYRDRAIYCDSKRSDEGSAPHKQYGGPEGGEEVLIESILLSRSSFFIHGISNVAYGALCFNPSLGHVNVYKKYDIASIFIRKSKFTKNADRPRIHYILAIFLASYFPNAFSKLREIYGYLKRLFKNERTT